MYAANSKTGKKRDLTRVDERESGLPNLPPPVSSTLHAPADPEVRCERPVRRKFSGEQKEMILDAVDACSEPGQIGAILRRVGIYSSHIAAWRRQRDTAGRAGLEPKKRGRKALADASLTATVKHLQRENLVLQKRFKEAEFIIDFQKKLSDLLWLPIANQDAGERKP